MDISAPLSHFTMKLNGQVNVIYAIICIIILHSIILYIIYYICLNFSLHFSFWTFFFVCLFPVIFILNLWITERVNIVLEMILMHITKL